MQEREKDPQCVLDWFKGLTTIIGIIGPTIRRPSACEAPKISA